MANLEDVEKLENPARKEQVVCLAIVAFRDHVDSPDPLETSDKRVWLVLEVLSEGLV